ncbi:PREDICTED: uncharacterized protein LOC109173942 [Ipomoea nil]|uniref:uncharacterized protein LOC109173942 n=1 Tax=Ipomoea nil TaxID=35883 RepID=UPI0009011F16|nr:PREDICTED: uncharacterized protein LOC109173942 [Ipomoea nil]
MADPVRNIIIKLGSKTHSPEVALKHIQTLLQFAMKKKLKLDPLLRDEILVTVMTNYPEFYAEWSEDDAIELLMMVSEASDEVSPVSIPEPSDGNRAGAFLQYFAQRALESAERQEILRNRSNNSDTPIEISPDKPDDSATPSFVPVNTENLTALNSENPPVNVDPSSLPLSDSVGVKNDVLHVSDEKEKSSNEPNKLSLVVYSPDNTALPPAEIADDPKGICSAVDPPVLPANVDTVDLSSPHKSKKSGGIPVYTATSLGESLEHVRHFAGLPSASIPQQYRVIHSSESSSEDDKILAKVYGSQAPPSDIPTVEAIAHPDSMTFKIREISNLIGNSSANVVVETGDDSADVDQPEKRRKSSEAVKSEGNPPIQQVFKTLRSPQFVSPAAQAKWSTMVIRDLIVQRSVDENQLNSVCDILPLLNEVGLLKTVTDICPYSKLLMYEFYCNLNDEIDILTGPRPMQIFIRGRWYFFGPDMINEYYGLTALQEEAVTDWNLVAKTLTGGQTES